MILQQRPLAELARATMAASGCYIPEFKQDSGRMVEGSTAPVAVGAKFVAWLRRKPFYGRFRFWCVPEKNRILGVHLKSRGPFDRRQFTMICEHYETV